VTRAAKATSAQPPPADVPQAGARPAGFRRTARRLLDGMRADHVRASGVLVLTVMTVAATTVIPLLLGHATDTILAGTRHGGVDVAAVTRTLAAVPALAVLAWLTTVAQGRLIATVVQRTAFRMREQISLKLSRLPLRYFDDRPRGEVLSRATNDIDNIAQTVQQIANRVLASALLLVGSVAMMLVLSPSLTAIVLITVPVTIWTTRWLGRRAQPRFAEQWAATGRLNGHIEEMYTGHELVTAFGRWPQATDTFARHNHAVRFSSVRAQFVSGLIAPAMAFLGNLAYVLVAVAGGLLVAAGTLSIGGVQAFVQYVMQFNQPVTTLASLAGQIQSAVASAERVYELLDAREQEPDPAGAPLPADRTGRVSFTNVTFRYRDDEPLIENLSLDVDPGRMIAIVGPTGAGKTTLVNLLLRFYELDGGTITIDGHDLAAMPREHARRHIGMVLQDTWLFHGTIADNIAFGAPDASREQIAAAARAVHADHLIRTLPDGYDTMIDEESGGLSTGERQLITIARAFLIDPAVLVLDEATSSVDTRTEMLVQQAMNSLRRGRTSFVIAHRLSTIRGADTILVMHAGRIVEQGTHHELLTTGGAYAQLHSAQLTQTAAL
jgi:ATP-binding cassette subfamily B multidrug efflux pump